MDGDELLETTVADDDGGSSRPLAAAPSGGAACASGGTCAPLLEDGRHRRLSHELGTPLNALLGHLELLLDGSLGPVTPEVRSCLHDIQTAGRQTRHQVELVLLLVQAQGWTAAGPLEPVELRPVLEEAWQQRDGWRRGDLALAVPKGFAVLTERPLLHTLARTVVDLYRAAAGAVAGSDGPAAPLRIALAGSDRVRIGWTGLDPLLLPAIEVALLEALVRQQDGSLSGAEGMLDLCWPECRLMPRPSGAPSPS